MARRDRSSFKRFASIVAVAVLVALALADLANAADKSDHRVPSGGISPTASRRALLDKARDTVEIDGRGRRLQQAKATGNVEDRHVTGRLLQQDKVEVASGGAALDNKCSSCIVCSIIEPISAQPVGCIQCFTDGCLKR